jgi:hypothetical protein
MTRRILWAVVIVSAVLIGLFPARQATADVNGSFPPSKHAGIALFTYSGGSVNQLQEEVFEKGCGMVSLWTAVGGRLVGYIPRAPAFANAAFLAVYPEGQISSGAILLVACQEGGIGGPGIIVPPGCLQWPEAVAEMLRVLTVPEGLCLKELDTPFPPSGALYVYGDRSVRFRFPDSLPQYPEYVKPSESVQGQHIANAVCYAHQHQMMMDAGLVYDSFYGWSKTPEGKAFMKALDWSLKDGVWYRGGVPQKFLDPQGQMATVVCSVWYTYDHNFLSDAERSWAEEWLPLP